METLLTLLFMFVFGVFLFTIITRNSPTNKYAPHFDYKATIIDGMKGMAIGLSIVVGLYYLLGYILTHIYCG
jgi:hypothetical protein